MTEKMTVRELIEALAIKDRDDYVVITFDNVDYNIGFDNNGVDTVLLIAESEVE